MVARADGWCWAPAPRHAAPARTPVDLTPAAAVPLSPILAAAREHSVPAPSAQRSQTHGPSHTPRQSEATAAGGPRPLRSARLSVREDLGFDVAPTVNTAEPAPYLVPGVAMPRQRDGATPGRPVAPERLYRPYLPDNGTTAANPDIVDLTLYDETTQLSKIDGRRTGTA